MRRDAGFWDMAAWGVTLNGKDRTMAGDRDHDRWSSHQESRQGGERRPWEGYRRRSSQAPDYGSAGGQYTSRVGPDQNPYTEDEGAYAGARNRSYHGEGNYNQGVQHDWERDGRGQRGGYGQVGGEREQARDEGGYSRASRGGEGRYYGQGGHGEERDWGRDRGDFGQYGESRFDHGYPPDAGQLAYGSGSQNYGQTVGDYGGSDDGPHHDDTEYRDWRREQPRRYDQDYGSWRESQLRRHDDDYAEWRQQRQEGHGSDPEGWRTSKDASTKPGAATGSSGSGRDRKS
ncbi:MAG: hypothetical protein AB7O49_15585 [Sphingomonadales bacterium]